MDIALPSARGLFSHMQEALFCIEGKIVALARGVHQFLTKFCWLAEELCRCSTRLYEIVPIQPIPDGYHDASGYMCGGAVLPGPTTVPRNPQQKPSTTVTSPETVGDHPIVW